MIPHSDDHDPIQGSIGLSVASPIEAMAVRFATRGRNRTGAAEFGESGLGTDAPTGDQRASAMKFFVGDDWLASASAVSRDSATNPARVRSRIKSRSNWASAPNTWKMRRPPGVVVSIASVKDRRPAPFFSNWFTVSIRCGSERARRSSSR